MHCRIKKRRRIDDFIVGCFVGLLSFVFLITFSDGGWICEPNIPNISKYFSDGGWICAKYSKISKYFCRHHHGDQASSD
jgi:hypothetical protein